ncbi:MAG: YqgE/AlgH family protein [Alphaproteobacteria bacterium]|nr:YqgE/AlgH family protein [Alphaproteobacteria bacterium]
MTKASKKKGFASIEGYLQGHLLIASPMMNGSSFAHALVFICTHDASGAMGLVMNQRARNITSQSIFRQLEIETTTPAFPIGIGGPVQVQRGFILHSTDYTSDSTIECGDLLLTSSTEIMQAIAAGDGPEKHQLFLGYSGWGPDQLEGELAQDAWIVCPFSNDFVFGKNWKTKQIWRRSLQHLGIEPNLLTQNAVRV